MRLRDAARLCGIQPRRLSAFRAEVCAGRRVNRRCRFNITGVIQNAQAASGLPRALRITMLCLAPRPALLCGKPRGYLDVGEAAPPPHPRCSAARLRLAAFNCSLARPRVAFARLQPCGLPFRARCASLPSAPRGSPKSKAKARLKKKPFAFARARRAKCASRAKTKTTGESVFFISPQTRSTLQENARRYDDCASGGLHGGDNVYTYVEGNPINKVDPLGLKGSFLDWLDIFGKSKCTLMLPKILAADKECDAECTPDSSFPDQVKYMEKYSASFLSEANMKCICAKLGKEKCKEAISCVIDTGIDIGIKPLGGQPGKR